MTSESSLPRPTDVPETVVAGRPLVSVEELVHLYPGCLALDRVTLAFRAGEIHALLGANGAGKSTLVKVLSGAISPTSGRLVIDGVPENSLTPRSAAEAGIRTIHQEFTLVPHLNVADNLFLGREPRRRGLLDRSAMNKRAAQVLKELGTRFGPKVLVRELSVADQQLVEIAKAVVDGHAKLLIMDEPTSGLAPREVESLFQLMRKLVSRGVGIIYISHRIDEVLAVSDRATVLRDGKASLSLERNQLDARTLANAIVGRELVRSAKSESSIDKTALPVLELSDVSNEYLKHISLAVRPGEILGVFGLVGSGRTRLARMIVGLDPSRSGEVRLGGSLVQITSPRVAIRLGIGFVPEDRKRSGLVLSSPVLWNATITSLARWRRFGFLSRSRERNAFRDVKSRLSIKVSNPMIGVDSLSGGNQQKVCLSRWLLSPTKVLVLDEPTRGVDVGAKAEIYEEIRQLVAAGLAVIVFSSEAEEIALLADRAIAMVDGWIREELILGEDAQTAMLLAAGSDIVHGGAA